MNERIIGLLASRQPVPKELSIFYIARALHSTWGPMTTQLKLF